MASGGATDSKPIEALDPSDTGAASDSEGSLVSGGPTNSGPVKVLGPLDTGAASDSEKRKEVSPVFAGLVKLRGLGQESLWEKLP